MLSRFLLNITRGTAHPKNFFNSILLIFGAVTAGYTIVHFPQRFLELFSHPVGQFLVFLSLSMSSYYMDPELDYSLIYIVIDAIIYTAIFQIIYKLSHPISEYIRNNTPIIKSEIKNIKIEYEDNGNSATVSGILPTNQYSVKWSWDNDKLNVWAEQNRIVMAPVYNDPFYLYIHKDMSE